MTASTPPLGRLQGLVARISKGRGGITLAIGAVMTAVLAVLTILFLIAPPPGAASGSLMTRFRPPALDGFLFGSDQLGRSVAARVADGMGWSLGVVFVATVITLALGTLLGLIAAWLPGWPRRVIRTLVDTIIAFPSLIIAVTVIAVLGRGFWPLALTLGVATAPVAARVVFAEAMSIVKRDYVTAAILSGVSPVRALVVHVLPALRPTLLTMFAFTFADLLIAESALSFLGLGVPLTSSSWGRMLSESREYLVTAPWMMLAPAGAIVFAVVALNLVGDGIAARSRGRSRT